MRNDLEVFRLLAFLAVIAFHAKVGISGGVQIFALLSFYLSGRPKPLAKRSKKLLLPWAVFFVVYCIFNYLKGIPILNFDLPVVPMLLTGPAIHLWYLPFVFIFVVLFDFLKVYLPHGYLLSLLAVLLLLSLMLQKIGMSPYDQYVRSLPYAILGGLAWCFRSTIDRYSIPAPNVAGFSKLTYGGYLIHVIPLSLINNYCDPVLSSILTFVVSLALIKIYFLISKYIDLSRLFGKNSTFK